MSNPPATYKKLGQLLVERGWITGEQLIRAIQSQRVVGGRIGTCLLEMDVLTEDKLLEALSCQLSVPAARIEELRAISRDVLKLIPPKVASRWQAVPLSAGETDIQVATLNVKNLACLDEITFCTNKRVLPHIANEARIFEALERYYGAECPRRYGHLLDRLNRSRYLWDESARVLLGGGEAQWNGPGDRPASDLLLPAASRSTQSPPASDGEGLGAITWPTSAERASTGYRTSGGSVTAPATLTLDDVEQLLAGQTDQRSIGQIILRFLGQRFSRSAIFAVRKDRIRGWLEHGEGFDVSLFRSLDLKLDQPSAFLGLVKGADFFLGPLAPMPAHRDLARCWGGELPQQCLMVSIRLRGRLVSILYGDRGARGLRGVEVEQIKKLAEKAAIAFELCILRRKLQHQIASS